MADLLYELLATDSPSGTSFPSAAADPDALSYLAALASRPLSSLQSEEPLSLSQSAHSTQLALQGLAKKSYQPVLESAKRHEVLKTAVPDLVASAAELRRSIPSLDDEVVRFSTTYRGTSHNSSLSTTFGTSSSASGHSITSSRRVAKGPLGKTSTSGKPDLIARRRQALLLSRNVERLVDVLELPPLLASSVATAPVNYASALDLNGHIRRLYALYPDSPLVKSVAIEAEESMRATAASLVLSLKTPSLKLAASLRTISWLRRVLPDIEAAALAAQLSKGTTSQSPSYGQSDSVAQERALGALFLICRLSTLTTMLDALAPLRELADQERSRQRTAGSSNTWSGGQQTERYLKRYIEIFREQSFAIVSMFRSIFPETSSSSSINSSHGSESSSDGYTPTSSISATASSTMSSHYITNQDDPLEPLPSALSTFPLHLVDMLLHTLRDYLPSVGDQASRDSLLTQVLYCAGSLGRLGGDFGLFLATLDVGEDAEAEWVEVVRRHRQLAGRLESIVGDPVKK